MSVLKGLYQRWFPVSLSSEMIGKEGEVTNFSSNEPFSTPFNRAKQEWDDRMGSLVVSAKNWRLSSIILSLTLFSCVMLLYKQSNKPPIKPMIVEVNSETGKVNQIIDVSAIPFSPSHGIKKHFMWLWVKRIRSLPRDLVLVNNQLEEMYYFVSDKAKNKLSQLINSNHPFIRFSEGETVSVDFVSMHQMTDNSYYFQWKETTYLSGKVRKVEMWSSTLTVDVKPPKDEKTLMINPAGIWIDDFSFSKLENFKEDNND